MLWHEYGRGPSGFGTLYADEGLTPEYIRKYIHPHCRNNGGVEVKIEPLPGGALLLGKSWPLARDNSGRAGFVQWNVILGAGEAGAVGRMYEAEAARALAARLPGMNARQLAAIPAEEVRRGKRGAFPRVYLLAEIAKRLAECREGEARYIIGSYFLSQEALRHATMFVESTAKRW
jgi:hypothetical protein